MTPAAAIGVPIAVLLLTAGLSKLAAIDGAARTLTRLGVPTAFARALAVGVAAFEMGAGAAVLFRPDLAATQLAVLALAMAFAAAGGLALRLGQAIPCQCFGPSSASVLGWRQVGAIVPWTAAVFMLHLAAPHPPPLVTAAAWFAGIALLLAIRGALRAYRAFVQARGDRLMTRDTLVWLPSR